MARRDRRRHRETAPETAVQSTDTIEFMGLQLAGQLGAIELVEQDLQVRRTDALALKARYDDAVAEAQKRFKEVNITAN